MADYLGGTALIDTVTIAASTTDSGTFTIPEGAVGLGMWIGSLTAATTLKLQALKPQLIPGETDTWADVQVFDLTDGTFETLDGLGVAGAASFQTLPVSAICATRLKFVASGSQTGGAVEIRLIWRRSN